MTRKEYEGYLTAHLKPKRYKHCLGVEQCAVELARLWGADAEKASLAGLLHDCAKWMKGETLIEYLRTHGYPLDAWDMSSQQTLHAPAGAYLARETLGVQDEEVLHAIACHAVPGENMGLLDIIISLSDFIEPYRKEIPGLDEIRSLARTDLREAYHRYLGQMMGHLLQEDILVHPRTLLSYNQYFLDKLAERPSG